MITCMDTILHSSQTTSHCRAYSMSYAQSPLSPHLASRGGPKLTLASYKYSLVFRTSTANGNADALSRLPFPQAPKQVPIPPEVVLLMEHLEMAPVTAVDIKRETAQSPLLASILQKVLTGWTYDCDRADLKPFRSRRMELSAQQGCILWGSRVVVPASLRTATLQLLHDSNPGISRMKSLGRMFVWWPGFDQDVEEVVQQCATCQRSHVVPAQAPLHPWEWPAHPWSRLHVDYAGPYLGHRFLGIDAHSKWLEVCPMTSTTAVAMVERLRSVFAQFGIPDMVVTDNRTNFVSAEFQQFMYRNGVRHVTSAPAHSASNGLAERAVRIFKEGLARMKEGSMMDRLSRFLFWYRNTPQQTTGVSPAELLMGRRLRSALDLVHPDLASRVAKAQAYQKKTHDKHARFREFNVGDSVFARNFGRGHSWVPAVVLARTGPVSWQVEVEETGLRWRRHVDQIRRRYSGVPEHSTTWSEPVTPTAEVGGKTPEAVGETQPSEPTSTAPTPTPTPAVTESEMPHSTPGHPRYLVRVRKPPDRLTY